jgi:hypothetical protein
MHEGKKTSAVKQVFHGCQLQVEIAAWPWQHAGWSTQ